MGFFSLNIQSYSLKLQDQKQTFAFTIRDKAIQAHISEKGEYIGLKSCVCVCVLSHSLLSDSLLGRLGSSVHGIFQARILG